MAFRAQEIKSAMKRRYDLVAEEFVSSEYDTPVGRYFMKRKIDTALELGRFIPGECILEVGCSLGMYTFEFAQLGFTVIGFDLSHKSLAFAKRVAEQRGIHGVHFVVGDAEHLPFRSDRIPGAISFSTLRYVPNPQQAVNEIRRVTKKGGPIVVDFANKLSPWFSYIKPWLTKRTHIYDHHYRTTQVKAFLSQAGCRGVVAKRILYTPKQLPTPLLPIMKAVDFFVERLPLNAFAAIIIAGGRK